jgi:hypothetical protein
MMIWGWVMSGIFIAPAAPAVSTNLRIRHTFDVNQAKLNLFQEFIQCWEK